MTPAVTPTSQFIWKVNLLSCCSAKVHLCTVGCKCRVISNYSKRLSKLIKSICRVTLLFHVLWCQKAHHLSEHNFLYSGVATMEIHHYVEHWCPLVLIIWPFDWINNDWNYVQSIQAGKKHTFLHWGFAIVWHFYFTPITYIY